MTLTSFLEDRLIMLTKEELKKKYKTANDLIARVEQVKGNTFGFFDVNHRLDNMKNKGALGQIVEEGVFGYPINSDPSADFDYLGLELKTTGVIQNKNKTISAKERLPLDNINYLEVANHNFMESNMWLKSKGLFLVLYKYIYGSEYKDMPIVKGIIHRFPPEDLAIIMQDYNKISEKIRNGKAELLSEADTMYLGACTSGKDSNDLVAQPFSNVLAKKRKFCLKQSYVTQIIREKVNYSELEHIFSFNEIKNNIFEALIERELIPFFGKTESQLQQELNIDSTSKSKFERYIARMLSIKGKVNNTDEFIKANIELKTIRVEENGTIKESMSFPYFKFVNVANTPWDYSELKEMLENKKFLFAIFKKINGEFVFKGIKFWNMPVEKIENECRDVYIKTAEIINNGNIIKSVSSDSKGSVIRKTNFPGMNFNGVLHVRPHGQNSNDVDLLPTEEKTLKIKSYTKQCFWINSGYIRKVIGE